ncbi:hypothetical protein [Raineya orbicola]|jgi:hypothetical protein|uniref:Glycosyl transferase family 2 n=1 Tax=Raineya orbicola TaxID=2016530 RepID=A0A2N3IKU3_9BACT|nr:hypothetical protein [Raineya orbicola]PKQ70833.1 hypothetical protein Rain11_0179 [Raineya orbicola]
MKKQLIKVGFLVSYDWYLLKNALPLVYADADIIYLALDKKRLTWSGNPFDFDEKDFQNFIQSIDINKKIHIYEDDFYVASLTPMQCEVRERNMLAKAMGEGGWHIQLDADEYFINFGNFIEYLQQNPVRKETNICVCLINLFKKTNNGYICIKTDDLDLIQVASNKPYYEYGRKNGYFNHTAPFYMLHDTWARNEGEVWQKISNWGHKTDFDTHKYFDFWKSIDENNYSQIRNFHPLQPEKWKKLVFLAGRNVQELIQNFQNYPFPLSKFQLFLKNNRNIARIKHLWNKIFK